jgi:YaiO family outer membrane protein
MTWPSWIVHAVVGFNFAVLFYFAALNTLYLGLFLLSLGRVRRFVRKTFFSDYGQLRDSGMTWPISVLVPARNEERTIIETVKSLMNVSYSQYEIIVINDGSSDATLRTLIDEFGLRQVDRVYKRSIPTETVRGVYTSLTHPNLAVVDKEAGGKADALNAGINLSRYPLFCSIDADSMIEENALLRVVKPFMETSDETVAAGGIVRIANGCRVRSGRVTRIELPDRALPIFQAVEYLRAFLAGRVGWSALQSLLIISGAFGIYKKSKVLEVGGYSRATETEDMELIVRLHRHLRRRKEKYRIVFVPDPVCWTEVPSKLRTLLRQRTRWHRGLIRTLWNNRGMTLNPRYGTVGIFAIPYFIVFEGLGPFVEILGYAAVTLAYFMGLLSPEFFLLFLVMSLIYGAFLSIGAVLLEEISFRRYPYWLDLIKLIVCGILENFGYRQLLSLFKIKGFLDLLVFRRSWGDMERSGFKPGGDTDKLDGRGRGVNERTRGKTVASVLLLAALASPGSPIRAEGQSADEMFERARTLAFDDGDRESARELCRQILERSPNYTDVRVFLGRLFAWDRDYESARRELRGVVEEQPDNDDARSALIDVELWDDRPGEALRLADEGLASDPNDAELAERRVRALDRLGRPREALEAAETAYRIDPSSRTLRRRYHRLLDEVLPNKISFDYQYEHFDDDLGDWHFYSVDYRRAFAFGSLIGRVNYADRFHDTGTQYEIDAYPEVGENGYAYLNFGVSSSRLFPDYRYGAEYFHSLPKGWEGSLGFRMLDFDTNNVWIYTGTIAKYLGNYWIAWRPNYVDKDDGSSFSNGVAARRYFGSRWEYAEISASGGVSNEDNLPSNVDDRLNDFKIKAALRKRVAPRWILKGAVGYRDQELSFGDRSSYFVRLGVDRFF